jgi:hypothetical protein
MMQYEELGIPEKAAYDTAIERGIAVLPQDIHAMLDAAGRAVLDELDIDLEKLDGVLKSRVTSRILAGITRRITR